MLDNGIIERCYNPWAIVHVYLLPNPMAPIVFCTDFRRVNEVTRTDCYPLPRIDSLIDEVGNAKSLVLLKTLSHIQAAMRDLPVNPCKRLRATCI